MSVSETVIAVRGLVKSYGARAVLQGVDLEVRRGQVLGLLGPNGAGKTTLVEILEGYRTRDGGEVSVLGLDPAGQPANLRARVGLVLQQCALPGELRVAELVRSYCELYERPRPVAELLELVELTDQAGQRVGTLSGGQQRRVDLALALAGRPELVFLDEPTTGFDPASRRRCWEVVRGLTAEGTTVVLTTHYLDEAEALADEIAVLVGGRIAERGSPRELARRDLAPTSVRCHLLSAADVGALPRLDGEVVVDRHRLSVLTRDPKAVTQALLEWDGPGDRIAGLTVTPPTLEDIYLELTA